MEHGHKSFICYRKKPSDNEVHRHHPTLQWSENVAGLLSYMINTEPEFSSVAPALFQESTSPTDLIVWNDTPEGIVKNVSAVSYFYVALCPDFFDPIIREYREELNVAPETAVENIIKRLSSAEKPIHVPIACIELLYAMVNTNIQICPIHIVYHENTDSPYQRESDAGKSHYVHLTNDEVGMLAAVFEQMCKTRQICPKDKGANLQDHFASKLRQLFFVTNPPEINYASVKQALDGITWDTESTARFRSELMGLVRLPSVLNLKKTLEQFLKPIPPVDRIRYWQENDILRTHLAACANFTSYACVPPRSNGSVNPKDQYSALDDNIVYDPLYADQAYPYPRLPYSLIRNYRGPFKSKVSSCCKKYKDTLGLPSYDFAYWPVDFYEPEEREENAIPDFISVCAICFGTLISYHRLTKDSCGSMLVDKYNSIIQDGINLLIALRNPNSADWPAQWKIENGIADVDGTINQTTLSLSTLMSCGFLSCKEPESVNSGVAFFGTDDPKFLKSRHAFIRESVNYLLNGRGCIESPGWSYTCESPDEDAILPTVFVFNVLVKYHLCLDSLIEFFSPRDPQYAKKLSQERDHIKAYIDETIEYYFAKVQRPNGSFYAVRIQDESITHTAYVLKCLCDYSKQFPSDEKQEDIGAIIKKAETYLIGQLTKRSQNPNEPQQFNRRIDIKNHERFEEFIISRNPKKYEKYEHCAELIVAEALIKVIEYHNGNYPEAVTMLSWLAATYIQTVKCPGVKKILIPSERVELQYPIYYVYYYRMFISDFIKLLDANSDILKSEETL